MLNASSTPYKIAMMMNEVEVARGNGVTDDSLINDDQIKCTELCNCRIELYAKHFRASKGEEKQNTHAHNNTSN